MDKSRIYLGVIRNLKTDGKKRGARAMLLPLFVQEEDGSKWEPVSNPTAEFPNRGMIYWAQADADAHKDTLWQFQIEESYSFEKENPARDQYSVVSRSAHPAREVLDFENCDPDDLRESLTTRGLVLTHVPAPQIFLKLPEKIFIGPVNLIRNDSRRWVIASNDFIFPVSEPITNESLQILAIDKVSRIFLKPGGKAITSIGQIDWSPDDALLRHVLHSIRRMDQMYANTLGLTDEIIKRSIERLLPEGAVGQNRILFEQRLQRAQKIVSGLTGDSRLLAAMEDEMLAQPAVQFRIKKHEEQHRKEVEAQLEEEVAQKKKAAEREFEVQRAGAVEHLDQLAQEVDKQEQTRQALGSQLEELQKQIEAKQALLENQVDALDKRMKERLAEITLRPQETLVELAIIRAALKLSSTTDAPISQAAQPATNLAPNRLRVLTGEANYPKLDESHLKSLLRDRFRANQLPVQMIGALHAAFLARCVPILAGANALQALETYASLIMGNRLLWIPVSPITLEPSDIIGKADPATKRFIPHPAGLVDLLVDAKSKADNLYLVVLDGITKAPTNSYLDPVLSCYTSAWSGSTTRSLPIIHPSLVSEGDPYNVISQLNWPSNVLLAATIGEGITIPPARSLWSFATFINVDLYQSENETLQSGHNSKGNVSYVSMETWEKWQAQASGIDRTIYSDELAHVREEKIVIRQSEIELCLRFCQGAQIWYDDAKKVLEQAMLSCIVPIAVSANETEAFVEMSGKSENGKTLQNAVNLAAKLIS